MDLYRGLKMVGMLTGKRPTDFAKHLGFSSAYISLVFRGEKRMPHNFKSEFEKFYDMDFQDLVTVSALITAAQSGDSDFIKNLAQATEVITDKETISN